MWSAFPAKQNERGGWESRPYHYHACLFSGAGQEVWHFKARRQGKWLDFIHQFNPPRNFLLKMLPNLMRLYFWGVHGIFVEIVFTSIWEFVVTGDWRLIGMTSLWSFLVYGLGTFLVAENIYNFLTSRGVPLLARCLVYVVFTYAWEFCCGLILDCFNARSWDYSHFNYNVMGLITMEYAPFWFFGGMYGEMIFNIMKSLQYFPEVKIY